MYGLIYLCVNSYNYVLEHRISKDRDLKWRMTILCVGDYNM